MSVTHRANIIIWDSLAICEYLAEVYAHLKLWPESIHQRAQARAICAEMHSGFHSLRSLCGMNIEANLADIGQRLWSEHQGLRTDVARIEGIWAMRTQQEGFLYGEFGIADAFYTPIVMRLLSYQLPISAQTQCYIQQVLTVPAVQKWMVQAKREHHFVTNEEPYRSQRT